MNVLGFCGFGLVALFWTCVLYSLYIFPIFLWMLLILVWPIISGLLCLKETLFTYILQLSTLGLAVLFLCEIEIIQKTHVNGTDMFGFTVIYACIIFGYYKYAKNLGLLSNTPMTSAEVEEKKKPQKEDKKKMMRKSPRWRLLQKRIHT